MGTAKGGIYRKGAKDAERTQRGRRGGPEILANIALRDGANAAVEDVIMDEFHRHPDHSTLFLFPEN
ncbi:MAG: hypothetical protein ACRDBP_18155 [Luteolibacter sp.]